jgi:hypothetical protein
MKAQKIRIRTKKSDSAFIYHTLEAHEGLTAYRTIPHQVGDLHRDVELMFSPDALEDVKKLISELQQQMDLEVVDRD